MNTYRPGRAANSGSAAAFPGSPPWVLTKHRIDILWEKRTYRLIYLYLPRETQCFFLTVPCNKNNWFYFLQLIEAMIQQMEP